MYIMLHVNSFASSAGDCHPRYEPGDTRFQVKRHRICKCDDCGNVVPFAGKAHTYQLQWCANRLYILQLTSFSQSFNCLWILRISGFRSRQYASCSECRVSKAKCNMLEDTSFSQSYKPTISCRQHGLSIRFLPERKITVKFWGMEGWIFNDTLPYRWYATAFFSCFVTLGSFGPHGGNVSATARSKDTRTQKSHIFLVPSSLFNSWLSIACH